MNELNIIKSVKLNTLVGKTFHIFCKECLTFTEHTVLTNAESIGSYPMSNSDETYDWNDDYQILQCLGCKTPSFRSNHTDSEDFNEVIKIYPVRDSKAWTEKSFYNLPFSIKLIYIEVVECYNRNNLFLCAAGLRALVEGICKDKNIVDGATEILPDGKFSESKADDLRGKINGLAEKGIISTSYAESLHEQRFLGNKTLHELKTPKKDEIKIALEIIEHIFHGIYEIPSKTEELKNKRTGKKEIF